jgi:hypothetical protein
LPSTSDPKNFPGLFSGEEGTSLDIIHYTGHFHCRHCCIRSGVAHFRTGPFDSLLKGIAGQHAKCRRHGRIIVDLGDTPGYLLADIIVMTRLAAYDRAKTDNSYAFTAFGQSFRGHDNLTSTGHPDHTYLFVGGPMTSETVYRTGKESASYELIEPADHDCVTAAAGCYLTSYFFNHWISFLQTIFCMSIQPSVLRNFNHGFSLSASRLTAGHYKTVRNNLPEKQNVKLIWVGGSLCHYES